MTPRVLALGAWLKNRACLLDGAARQWSPLHGDLGDPANCIALEQSAERLLEGTEVHAIAHDLHPDFHSTRLAHTLAQRLGVPAIGVQHHHAHIAAVQAEHNFAAPLIGLALDGVGLGTDGMAWGGELLWVHGARWQRFGHLSPLALPGGDVAAREPWRMAAAALHALGRADEIGPRFGAVVGVAAANTVRTMLERDLHCPRTSSAGRWFDAAAGVLGLSHRQNSEAEAAIVLERLAGAWLASHRLHADPMLAPLREDGRLDLRPLMVELLTLADSAGAPRDDALARGAALFHVSLADGLARWAGAAAGRAGVATVALGGGCFLNRVLSERLVPQLRSQGLTVLQARGLSCGDAGLALGQAWVAADRLRGSQRSAQALLSSHTLPIPTHLNEPLPCV
jgi:hydrogenase maturation protein HypF